MVEKNKTEAAKPKKEKQPKAPKVKKIREKKKYKFGDALFIIVSLVITAVVFIGLIVLENRLSGKVIYSDVVTAKTNVPKNTIITEKNLNDYFEIKKVDSIDDVSGSLSDLNSLLNKKSEVSLVRGEIILLKDFIALNKYTDDIVNPVTIAVNAGNLSDIAGGIIRAGDLINISVAYTNTDKDVAGRFKSTYVIENVYVSKAMDSSGAEIGSSDTKGTSTMLLLIVDKETEQIINNALANGELLRISKSLDIPETE